MARPDYLSTDTIAAAATALGGPIAIVRVSGPKARASLLALAGREPEARLLTRARLRAQDGRELDDAMVVAFHAPETLTGEDCVELHLHGGSFGVRRVLEELFSLGVRQALPGEFSFRAVRNGKLRLEQAYAVADLISASNAGAMDLALEKLSGLQSKVTGKIAEDLRRLAALGELGIDFSDQDIEEVSLPFLKRQVLPLLGSIERLAESHGRGIRLQEGVSVAIVGLPNAGKSSFFNALLGEDRSIVSETPGTTRDLVREKITLKGELSSITLRLEDTAGLRPTAEEIEKQGIERAIAAAKRADLVLFVMDASAPTEPALRQWTALQAEIPALAEKTLGLLTKLDLAGPGIPSQFTLAPFGLARWVRTSSVTGEGIPGAIQSITAVSERWIRRDPGELLLTRQEQVDAARQGSAHLRRALEAQVADLFAADLRQALHAMGPVIGDTPPDAVLGRIFSDFCIGK